MPTPSSGTTFLVHIRARKLGAQGVYDQSRSYTINVRDYLVLTAIEKGSEEGLEHVSITSIDMPIE